jgi:hypothetical protein
VAQIEWLRASADDPRTDDQLTPCVEIGTGYTHSLPPKYKPASAPRPP